MQPSSVGTTQRNISDAARPYLSGFNTRRPGRLPCSHSNAHLARSAAHFIRPFRHRVNYLTLHHVQPPVGWIGARKYGGSHAQSDWCSSFCLAHSGRSNKQYCSHRDNKEQSVREATVQMERLATKLEHAKKIASETKLEIDRLIHHPQYDCKQVACRTALEVRNRAARERLQAASAGSKASTELSVDDDT